MNTALKKQGLCNFLAVLFAPEDLVEVRLLPSGKRSWHKADDIPEEFAKLHQANKRGDNVYFGVNPRSGLGGKAEDVLLARTLFVDFDGGVTPEQALDKVEAAGLPYPTIVLDSGHGVHCYWRLSHDVVDMSTWTAAQKRLIAALGSDSAIHDTPRVMRLPGFLNTKSEPHVPCRLVECDGRRFFDLSYLLNCVSTEGTPFDEPAEVEVEAAAVAASNRHATASTTPDILERATRYMAATPGAAEGSRNASAFRLSAVLQNDFQLEAADARRLLGAWNTTCTPPLLEMELDAVLASGAAHAKREPGSKVNGSTGPSYGVKFGGAGGSNGSAKPDAEPFDFKVYTSAELDAGDFNLEYLVEGAYVARQPMILGGGHKTMKTSHLIDLGLSLDNGGHFLGYFKVTRPARVGIMSGESGMSTLQETARRVAKAAGRNLSDYGVFWSDELPRFGIQEHIDAVRRFIKRHSLEVLGIDPAYLCLPGGDAGNLFIQGEMLRGISEECQAAGCGLILAHHTKRTIADRWAPPELEHIAWSGFAEFARQWLLLGRRQPYVPGTGSHKLWLSVGGSAGHGGLWGLNVEEGRRTDVGGRKWDVAVLDLDEVKASEADAKETEKAERTKAAGESHQRKVVEVLTKAKGEPLSTSAIRDRAGINAQAAKSAVASLYQLGEVEPCRVKTGNNNREVDGWKLTKQNDSDDSDK